MAAVVADTHALVWYVEGSSLLSAPAQLALNNAATQGDPIYVPSVSLVEIVYLIEKGKLPADLFDRLIAMLQQNASALTEAPFTMLTAQALQNIPRLVVPEMPDRMIAATALALGTSLVTRDLRIQASNVPTIW